MRQFVSALAALLLLVVLSGQAAPPNGDCVKENRQAVDCGLDSLENNR